MSWAALKCPCTQIMKPCRSWLVTVSLLIQQSICSICVCVSSWHGFPSIFPYDPSSLSLSLFLLPPRHSLPHTSPLIYLPPSSSLWVYCNRPAGSSTLLHTLLLLFSTQKHWDRFPGKRSQLSLKRQHTHTQRNSQTALSRTTARLMKNACTHG